MTQSDTSVCRSEFGHGVVICVAKFAEHLSNHWAEIARVTRWWATIDDDRRATEIQSAITHPRGDAARRQTMVDIVKLEDALQMWANGARDHFLDLDRGHATPGVCELADLVLKMGDVYPQYTCTWDDFQQVYALWERACVELDASLGVTAPDWGEW